MLQPSSPLWTLCTTNDTHEPQLSTLNEKTCTLIRNYKSKSDLQNKLCTLSLKPNPVLSYRLAALSLSSTVIYFSLLPFRPLMFCSCSLLTIGCSSFAIVVPCLLCRVLLLTLLHSHVLLAAASVVALCCLLISAPLTHFLCFFVASFSLFTIHSSFSEPCSLFVSYIFFVYVNILFAAVPYLPTSVPCPFFFIPVPKI